MPSVQINRVPGADLRTQLGEALDQVGRDGGGALYAWISEPTPADDASAADAGLRPDRDLWQLRRPLPVSAPWSLDVRAFVPGRDEDAWLEVNNRAFAGHPEQGNWDRATLVQREAEPWFDPEGFLLHEAQGRLLGFCWTKVHEQEAPPLGEIYVIGVDPDAAGRGLGRALTLAGLDHLARNGTTIGMLYVDAANQRALQLYQHLGFEFHHLDRAYIGHVPPR